MRCQQQKMLRVLPPTYLACQTFRSSTCKFRDGHHNVWVDREVLISSRKCTALSIGMNTFSIWHIYQIAPLCSSRTLWCSPWTSAPGDVSVWNKGSHKEHCDHLVSQSSYSQDLKLQRLRNWVSFCYSRFLFCSVLFFPGMISVIRQILTIHRFAFILIPPVYKHF